MSGDNGVGCLSIGIGAPNKRDGVSFFVDLLMSFGIRNDVRYDVDGNTGMAGNGFNGCFSFWMLYKYRGIKESALRNVNSNLSAHVQKVAYIFIELEFFFCSLQ